MTEVNLRGRRVAITGERRAVEQAALVRALGGEPLVCPTARVAWEDDPQAPRRWVEAVLEGLDDAIFMTGMGTEPLLAEAERRGQLDAAVKRLLAARVVARGSKALPVLRRAGIRVDVRPQPATTTGVLHALGGDLRGRRVVAQLAGPEPAPLVDGLRAAGADVVAVSPYRYPAQAVVGAADALVDAILGGDVEVVTFTSAPAVEGLVAASVARGAWPGVRRQLNRIVVAAVGPVTADSLAAHAVAVRVQPIDPHMGPLMREVAAALGDSSDAGEPAGGRA